MEETYRQLARRLDAVPNGFPATATGVELQILARLFTPQEAALAARMRLLYEPAEAIAARVGMAAKEARRTLKEMARKGLIRARRGEGGLVFALLPFVVGIYEEQLGRMDAELATLMEEYFREIGGRTILDTEPPIHRVVPVQEAIPTGLEIFPHEQAAAIVESARSWGVRECICRKQQRLIGRGCKAPLESCLILAPVEGAFEHDERTRPITREEALQVLRRAEETGLVHTTGNFRDRHYYICNCCPCCCAVLRGLTEFAVPTAVARSGFRSVVDPEACLGCGACLERCPFGALSVPEDIAIVDGNRCLGCGVCVSACPAGALRLERLPPSEIPPLPTNIQEWMLLRAQARGLRIEDIL
ncbi:MAG: 4Fe-4S binding protein [Anaerolineae bacterium]|nr:4Fe-4S binding protein [Anaerolineae bacterium]MDW8067423.1 4Fe-4S binding protein [Anaerolineae bacterium]